MGRFGARDPIGYAGSKYDLYEYAIGNPVDRLDPMGKEPGGENPGMEGARYTECNTLEQSLRRRLVRMCLNVPPERSFDCMAEALRISSAIGQTCHMGGRPLRPRNPKAETHRGNWCYEWAYGYEDAVNNLHPEFFSCAVDFAHTIVPRGEDYRVHYWLELGDGASQVFIDDGFMPGFPGYIHNKPPCAGVYKWPPDTDKGYVGVFRDECKPVIAQPPRGSAR